MREETGQSGSMSKKEKKKEKRGERETYEVGELSCMFLNPNGTVELATQREEEVRIKADKEKGRERLKDIGKGDEER